MGLTGLRFPRQRINYWKKVPKGARTAIEHWSPQLFTICMGTGVMGLLMNRNSYQFNGLWIISIVVWILDLALFSIIALCFITRFILYPSATAKLFETDVEQTTYLSASSIAFATLVELLSIICGGQWKHWDVVSFVFWWIGIALALVAASTTYLILIRDEEVNVDNITPTLMYPVTGIVAIAAAGGVLLNYTPLETKLAKPVLIVSYLMLGTGFFFALCTVTAYFIRLLSNQNPAPKKAAQEYIPVAPFSNAAYAYASLSYVAGPKSNLLATYGKGSVAEGDIGRAVFGAGFLLGITIFGFATFWLILATITFFRDVRKTRFSLNMWSAAYPIGAYGLACSQLAKDLDSTAFKVVTSIMLVLLVIYWLMLVFYTVPSMISGELFLQHVVEEREKKEKKHDEERRVESLDTVV